MSAQQFPVYVINIDRAVERLQEILNQSEALSLEVERVVGTDGKLVPRKDWIDVDHDRFRLRHGRTVLDGEYGCYRSHLTALSQFLASGHGAAVIIEDDVVLDGRLHERAAALLQALPNADVIRLVNHRWAGFIPAAKTRMGDSVGRCLFGPQGSAAGYLVTRAGAEKLLRGLKVMSLPFDVALERGWDMDVSIYTTRTDILQFTSLPVETTIGQRKDYRAVKLPTWRRIPTHLFRIADFFRRLWYVLGPSRR